MSNRPSPEMTKKVGRDSDWGPLQEMDDFRITGTCEHSRHRTKFPPATHYHCELDLYLCDGCANREEM